MKLTTIIGARPQIIKASALSRAIRNNFSDKLEEVIIHTGQHYDQNMSEVFFTELDIPRPKYNLAVGSGKHGKQTALMTERLEEVFEAEQGADEREARRRAPVWRHQLHPCGCPCGKQDAHTHCSHRSRITLIQQIDARRD